MGCDEIKIFSFYPILSVLVLITVITLCMRKISNLLPNMGKEHQDSKNKLIMLCCCEEDIKLAAQMWGRDVKNLRLSFLFLFDVM